MADTVSYKCPNCGASISYNALSGSLKCEYCGIEFDVKTLNDFKNEEDIGEDKFKFTSKNTEKVNIDGKVTYVCPMCGGSVIGDENVGALTCPYCGSNIIDKEQFSGFLRPDLVIPFEINKDGAKKAYGEFLKGKWALPNDFAINNIVEKISGLYVPYWLFNADVSAKARFRTTRRRVYRSGDNEITETSYYLVYRDGNGQFAKVPVDGSSKLDDSLLDALEPYDYSRAKDFNSAYLSGFFADKYDEDENKTFIKANNRIKRTMEGVLASSVIGYSSVMLESSSINYKSSSADYALLPVYIFSTKYKDKTYHFAMNGQTGKFAGDLPMDNAKVIKAIILIFIVSFLVISLITYLILK